MMDHFSGLKLFHCNVNYNIGIGWLKRKTLAVTKPTVEITVDGNVVTVLTKITLMTINATFTLG